MTTFDHTADYGSPRRDVVLVAGVAWPRYKLIALALGVAVLLIVGLLTMSAAPAVLTGAAAAAVAWAVSASARRTDH